MDKIVETALVNALRYGVFTRRQRDQTAPGERPHHVDAERQQGPAAWVRARLWRLT